MVLGVSNLNLVLGGCAIFALVVAFASLIAILLRRRTNTRSPRLHIGLGAPLDQPIPECRPLEPHVLDESPEEPPLSDQPQDGAIVGNGTSDSAS